MTDYRLDNLSPRLFEHLVQELALGAITSTVTPFGDGPDGGREAIFEGDTHYGAESNYWSGYGVVQAKYRARLQTPARDAAWARTQLKKELQQYNQKNSKRTIPQYYIFATNAVLSPGSGEGKDSVIAILAAFATKHQLKGWDIWDYDKLRTLIGRDEKVRRSYRAWITPGDVLAELSEYLRTERRDYYSLMIKYLQRELLADQYAQLEQAGHSGDDAIPLSQVFIDLPTSLRPFNGADANVQSGEDSPRFVATVVKDAAERINLADSTVSTKESPSRTGRYVLIGGPGQGKTTVGQYVCQIFRSALLSDVPPHRVSVDARAALSGIKCAWSNDTAITPKARRLPFRVVLSDFAKLLSSGTVRSLMGYLAHKFSANTDQTVSAHEVERILTEYPSIIVLDGLDEVPSSTNRDEVITAVTNFSIDVAAGNLDVMIVGTSRPQGYNDEFSPRQYTHHYLRPLSHEDATKYGLRLAETRFGRNTERYRKVDERVQRAIRTPATARLMTTPLQVTILTLLVDRIGHPPEERWALFSEYYKLIFGRETERDIASSQVLRENREDVDEIHRRVGLALQIESERSGGTDARLTLEQFTTLVTDYLVEEGHSGRSCDFLRDKIIEAAANRLVFLVGLEAGEVGFEIRSLQEFMAAEGITESPDNLVQERLKQVASSTHWRNVFLFAAGKCFSERRYLRDTIEAICLELNDDPDNESFRRLLSGSELALDLLEDGPARRQPLKCRSLTRLSLRLLERSYSSPGRLAAIFEEDTEDIYLEELRQILVGARTAPTSDAWYCLAALIDSRGGKFEDLGHEIVDAHGMSELEFRSAFEASSGGNEWLSQFLFQYFEIHAPILDPDAAIGYRKARKVRRYGPWILSSYPDWLSWYAEFIYKSYLIHDDFNLRLPISTQAAHSSMFKGTSEHKKLTELIPPSSLPGEEAWRFYSSAGRFCAAPSAALLRGAVQASVDAQACPMPRFLSYRYPWPLAECLLAKETIPAEILLEGLSNGCFGDSAEWAEYERTFSDGVTLDYIVDLDPVITMDGQGVLYRFPFRASLLSGSSRSGIKNLRDIVDAFDSVSSPTKQQFLGDQILATISMSGLPRSTSSAPEWLDRIMYAECSHRRRIHYQWYELFRAIDIEDQRWSDLFSSLTINEFVGVPNLRLENPFKRLWQAFDSHADLYGLMVPIACILGSRAGVTRPSSLHMVSVPGEASSVVKVAALLINIAAGMSVKDLAGEIQWAVALDPRLVTRIVRCIEQRELSYKDECKEILCLSSIIGLNFSSLRDAFARNFARRRSNLSDSKVWQELGFPPRLLDLLQRNPDDPS